MECETKWPEKYFFSYGDVELPTTIYGAGNFVYGVRNFVYGIENFVYGVRNFVYGVRNFVHGAHKPGPNI